MKKISHSAFRKFMTCPQMYNLHYNLRLRPLGLSSALLFGSAMDEALNVMLLKTGDPYKVFKDNFTWEVCEGIQYHKDDLDMSIFNKEQLELLHYRNFEYKSWASLRVKGRMLIEKYEDEILPRINKVYKVQKELEGRRGFIDVIVDFDDYGKVLLDHKTASRPYKYDAIENDTQLSLYSHHENIDKVGFIVLNKKINQNLVKTCKKCGFNGSYSRHKSCPEIINGIRCHGEWTSTTNPEAVIQVLISDVPKDLQKFTVDSISKVEKCINAGYYTPNLNSCSKYYGKDCPYKNYCLHKDQTGLEYIKEETKKETK